MSKQSEAKKTQNYNPKPSNCANCQHFTSDKVGQEGYYKKIYYQEKNLRCGIGGFAVKKRGTCTSHSFFVNPDE